MPSDSGAARLMYPELPEPLTDADLHRLFTPSYQERKWAPTIARTAASQVALLVQLKLLQTIGRFRRAEEIPTRIVEHIARELGVQGDASARAPDRTLYRHRPAVLAYMGITSWGAPARALAEVTILRVARTRTDPADLINAAVDALVRHRFELPALSSLRRLAGSAHSAVNAAQWSEVCEQVSDSKRSALEALFVVDEDTQESPFALICRAPGRPSRKNLKALMERHHWLEQLPDPTAPLASIADSKVLQWANEARRLKAPELRNYVATRRYTLLLAVLRQARGQVLDDLTQMLLRLARRVEWKSEQTLSEWYVSKRGHTDSIIRTFHESLLIQAGSDEPAQKIARMDALFAAHGGREALEKGCAEYLRHEKKNWRPFAHAAFLPFRAPLLQVADVLPLQCTDNTSDLLRILGATVGELPPYDDYVRIENVGPQAVPRDWHSLVHDLPDDPQVFNRRQSEVLAVLELAAAIKAGEMFVNGSLS